MEEKVLSLCFPTYNRGWCMKEQIAHLRQCPKSTLDKVEIIISDNCSTDDTEEIVASAKAEGFDCVYNKNKENLGMDGNFVTCFKMAKGKYVWLLGDDDPIITESLVKLVDILSGEKEYGLVHLWSKEKRFTNDELIEFTDKNEFAKRISFWTTCISSNVVRTKYVSYIDFNKYMGTWFTLMPVYLTAAQEEERNLIVNFPIFGASKDFKRNGGYNFFKVFVENYLTIWKEYQEKGLINQSTFDYLKEDIFKGKVAGSMYSLLVLKQKGNFSTDNAWKILKKWYGKNFYLYYYPLFHQTRKTIKRINAKLHKIFR